jgi:hypothetical protein
MKKEKKPGSKPLSKNQQVPVGFWENPRMAVTILLIVTSLVYFRSLFLDYTRLDDSIFIVENAHYNADIKNLTVSFQRGLFNPTKDAYYRPVFLVDFILESRLFGTKPAGYHFTNLLFHLISVTLLFIFLRKIKIPGSDAFLLSLLFSVHPVLTQAVVWIPGRNDMLLMIFFLSGFILFLNYLEKGKIYALILQTLFLVIALFTKETAVIIPAIMAGFVLFYQKVSWKRLIVPAASWAFAVVIWYLVRSTATLAKNWISPVDMLSAGISRIGVVVQYLGKIFFPVNLAVFPEYEDITLIWGFLALALFTGLIIYSRSYRKPLTYLGLFWFLIFLLPVLIVPKTLNDQVFEHRLYLPIIGILLMVSQVIPFDGKTSEKNKFLLIITLATVFSVQSIYRTAYFKDPITFWTHAVEGSPHSAYAHTLLGTKVEDPKEREALFRKAYSLNPELKNLKYYYGKVLFERKAIDSAQAFIEKELATNPIPDAWFLLAQISFEKNRLDSAAMCLEQVISLDSYHPQANHNLVLLYYQSGKKEQARTLLNQMIDKGMTPGEDLVNMFKQ